MLELDHLRRFLALEQQQPAVEVVGQHGQLKMNAVDGPAPGRMGHQTRIVVGFLDQILGPSALIVEPHQQVDGTFYIGHEDPSDPERKLVL